MNNRINRHVKIVCTLGPASSSPEVIEKLLNAGLDIARLNLNYGTIESHTELINIVRSLSKRMNLNTGILLDLPGSKRFSGNTKTIFGPHMEFAIKQQADYIALSFIRSAGLAQEAGELLREMGSDIPIIVKIEKAQSLAESDSILNVCDGIMVARGDLASDISIEKVPIAQKRLIKATNGRGKPVITATQMLESMVRSPSPTRAEATDVANAVLDGTDAVMLSEETAMGTYPDKAVETMVKIIREAEAELPYYTADREGWVGVLPEISDATARAACQIAFQVQAKAIVAFTSSGTTARRVSKYRPGQPILAVTPHETVARRLALIWGVTASQKAAPPTLTEVFESAVAIAQQRGVAAKGDLLVITAGIPPLTKPGGTNLIKVQQV